MFKTPVDLKGRHLRPRAGQRLRERADPRADLHDRRPRRELRRFRDSAHHVGPDEKILPQFVLQPQIEPAHDVLHRLAVRQFHFKHVIPPPAKQAPSAIPLR